MGLRSDAAGLKDDFLAADGGGNPVGAFLKLMVNPFLFGKETPGTISIQTSILFAETPSHDGLRLMTWKGGAQGSPRKRTYLRSPSFFDESAVTLNIFALEVVQQVAALADEL